MRPSEKVKNDILGAAGRKSAAPERCVDEYFGFLPGDAREMLRDLFSQKHETDAEDAAEWLATLGTIFAHDYDDSPLSLADWQTVRDIVACGAGEMDIDLVSYIMDLVMEHKAL